MRRNPTPGEAALWARLRRRQLDGRRFRRQHVIGRWIVDFVCLPARLVVEVDGTYHRERTSADADRDARLARLGFTVLRLDEHEVLYSLDHAVERIRHALTA